MPKERNNQQERYLRVTISCKDIWDGITLPVDPEELRGIKFGDDASFDLATPGFVVMKVEASHPQVTQNLETGDADIEDLNYLAIQMNRLDKEQFETFLVICGQKKREISRLIWDAGLRLIGDLDMHCGECGIIEYCCDDGYAICSDPRFATYLPHEYAPIAEQIQNIPEPDICRACLNRDDCTFCDSDSERRTMMAEATADFVAERIGCALKGERQ